MNNKLGGLSITVAAALLLGVFGCGDDDAPSTPETLAPSPSLSAPVTARPTAAGTPGPTALPASAPGGPSGKIVFLSFRDVDREIYSINTDGSGETNLTNDPGVDENPDVSPDGTKIVWSSDRDREDLHLYVMDIDGGNVRQLTFDPGGDMSPRWSRDGTQIAFTRAGNIYVMPAEGGEETLLMEAIGEAVAPVCQAGSFPGGWSPDDRRIVYYSASQTNQVAQICTVDVETREITVIVSRSDETNVEPAWSPDGRYIAYRSIRGEDTEIYVHDLETGEERRLTDHPAVDIEPGWSPDGAWIAFPSTRENEFFDIFLMRADGSEVRRLTTHPAKDSEPVWVP